MIYHQPYTVIEKRIAARHTAVYSAVACISTLAALSILLIRLFF